MLDRRKWVLFEIKCFRSNFEKLEVFAKNQNFEQQLFLSIFFLSIAASPNQLQSNTNAPLFECKKVILSSFKYLQTPP